MKHLFWLVLAGLFFIGCGAKPDASVEKRSEKENQMMKQAGDE